MYIYLTEKIIQVRKLALMNEKKTKKSRFGIGPQSTAVRTDCLNGERAQGGDYVQKSRVAIWSFALFTPAIGSSEGRKAGVRQEEN